MSSSTFNPTSDKPVFVSRFPVRDHPQKDDIIADVREFFLHNWRWSSEKAKAKYSRQDVEAWSTSLCPDAAIDRARMVCLWITFLFLYDDLLDDMSIEAAQNSVGRLVDILNGRDVSEDMNEVEQILHELTAAVRKACSSPSDRQIILDETCRHITAEASKYERSKTLEGSLEEYLNYRIDDIGTGITNALSYWGQGIDLASPLLQDGELRTLEELAARQIILVNDMYSYRKEVKQLASADASGSGDYIIYNSVVMLLRTYQTAPSEAMEELKRLILAYEDRYLESLDILNAKYSGSTAILHAIKQVSAVQENIMGGNVAWSDYCGRYNS